jgi:hypothetical protein
MKTAGGCTSRTRSCGRSRWARARSPTYAAAPTGYARSSAEGKRYLVCVYGPLPKESTFAGRIP